MPPRDKPWYVIEQASFIALALSSVLVAAVAYVSRPSVFHRAHRKARERLVLGLPLATIVILGVNAVFFFGAQRAYRGELLMVPYISWSHFYPLGYLTAPIGHGNVSHITGNLTTTLVFAPVVEYIIGHKNSRRPLLRAVVGIPLAWYAVGVFVAVFSLGPSIGFSGVVFFFMGFVVVFYPFVTVALLIVSRGVSVVVAAVRDPVVRSSAGETFSTPGWANVGVDAHILGLLLGVGLAVLLARRRRRTVDGFRFGIALILLGLVQNVYALWTVDSSTYILFRGAGVALVGVLAVAVSYGVQVESSSEPFLRLERFSLRRSWSVAALVVPIVVISALGVMTGFGGVALTEDVETVSVGDYEVLYGDDIENERVVSIPLIDIAPVNFTASGAYVVSERRGAWYQQASRAQLRSNPSRDFLVGGLTWDERVELERIGVTSATNDATYSVLVTAENTTHAVYDSGPAETGVEVDGWRFELLTTDGVHSVEMERDDGTLRRAYLGNTTTVVEDVTFEVDDDRITASAGNSTAVLGHVNQDSRR